MRIKMAEYGASKPYENCFMRATERIYSGEPFSFMELQDYVLGDGNVILRIMPGFTLGEYISELEEDKIISFNPILEKFVLNRESKN